MPTEPIRVLVTSRDTTPPTRDPREAFWTPLRQEQGQSDTSISQLEAKLAREFGRALRTELVNQLSEPLRTLDSEMLPSAFRDLERFFFHFPDRDSYRYQLADVLSRLLEQRQQAVRENPSLHQAQDRIAAAAAVMFSTRIVGYSSMALDVTTGSFRELATAFDGNFDTFRVFLDAFVPAAFADVFSETFADRLSFAVTIPASAQQAFNNAEPQTGLGGREVREPSPIAQPTPLSASRERAEWLWRLANGSLIVPVLLSLFVMYYGLRMLSDIRGAQYAAIKPILEHQLKLLEQDRLRLTRDAATTADTVGKSVPTGTPPSTSTDAAGRSK